MNINALPLFEPVEKAIYVTHGGLSIIYQLSDHLCVKVGRRIGQFENEKLLSEAEIADALYRGGVSVPKPKGLFRFPTSLFEALPSVLKTEAFLLGFVQEFIVGSLYRNLPEDLREAAKKKYAEEIDRARALGFLPSPDGHYEGRNVLYTLNTTSLERAVLIDFEFWRMKDVFN